MKKGSKLVWWLHLDGKLHLEMAKITCLLKIAHLLVSSVKIMKI